MRLRPVLLAAFLAACAAPAFAQGNVIAERQAGLRAAGSVLEAVQATVRAGGDVRALVPRIETVQTFFADFPARFPAGSGSGETRALPAVWTNRAGFEAAWGNMQPQLAALRAAAASGDVAATGAALQATGGACANCHRAFRAR